MYLICSISRGYAVVKINIQWSEVIDLLTMCTIKNCYNSGHVIVAADDDDDDDDDDDVLQC